MPYHEISIKTPSASQLAKMRNGQSFRIARGNGIRLVVDSDRIKDIGNKFLKDKKHTMTMTMDEIKHNMRGNGIFGRKADAWMKKAGIKSAVYAAGDALKPMAHTAIDAGAVGKRRKLIIGTIIGSISYFISVEQQEKLIRFKI